MSPSERMQQISLRLADIACSLTAFLLTYAILLPERSALQRLLPLFKTGTDNLSLALAHKEIPSIPALSWILVVATLTRALILEYGSGLRPLHKQTYGRVLLLQLLAICAVAGAIGTICYGFSVPLYSRLFLLSYLCLLFLLTATYRAITKAHLARKDRSQDAVRHVVIVGRLDGIKAFLPRILGQESDIHRDIRGCLIDENTAPAPIDVPLLGSVSSLGDLLIHEAIDEVILIVPDGDTPWLARSLQYCDYFRVSAQIVHESLMGLKLQDLTVSGTQPFVSIMLMPEEERSSDGLVLKRVVDILLSLVALIVLSVPMLLIALLIKLATPQLPVFYRWNVVGYRGRRFTGYKFTTMIADADERKESLRDRNEMSGPVFKIRNDPRVTTLGKFLRKYSLNELPQFWSVLKGDMSLVGPRPASPHELKEYAQWHKRKLSVRPGITCLWQVRGRNLISNFDDWVKMDLEYIQKRSMRTDIAILIQTMSAVVRGTGS
jgi:exopolysaccharide biosynthesis polyprenyl glycosylphosphotransferase